MIELAHQLEAGTAQEFIIARNGSPAARLVPLAPVQANRSRRIGVAKSQFDLPYNIDATNQEVQRLFDSR